MLFPSISHQSFSLSTCTDTVSWIFCSRGPCLCVLTITQTDRPHVSWPQHQILARKTSDCTVTLYKHSCRVPSLWQLPGRGMCCELDRYPQGSTVSKKISVAETKEATLVFLGAPPCGRLSQSRAEDGSKSKQKELFCSGTH